MNSNKWELRKFENPDTGHVSRYSRRKATPEYVDLVIAADTQSGDGRSDWYWFRLESGDLIMGTYPQGDTYMETEWDWG